MRFGLYHRHAYTGSEIAVLVQQIAALLIAPFMLFSSGYTGLFTSRGLLSLLFDAGFSILPRAEALALSLTYRRTESELIVFFSVLAFALALGLISGRLLRGEKSGVVTRVVLAVLLSADLLLRLLPLPFNGAFGIVPAVLGFAVRLVCLVLVLLDLRACRRGNNAG